MLQSLSKNNPNKMPIHQFPPQEPLRSNSFSMVSWYWVVESLLEKTRPQSADYIDENQQRRKDDLAETVERSQTEACSLQAVKFACFSCPVDLYRCAMP